MKREDFDRAQDLLSNIQKSREEINRLIRIKEKEVSNKEFVCYAIEHYQSPGLMEKLREVITQSILNQIHAEQDNIAHLKNLFESL